MVRVGNLEWIVVKKGDKVSHAIVHPSLITGGGLDGGRTPHPLNAMAGIRR